ncbi:MAG TPA: TIGR03084 family metal-binding protein [Marmoricola sp.]|nr:TIGR03084 family metal-binding protein [Marmoricola sp.]
MTALDTVLADLDVLGGRLDDLVAGLSEERWCTATPAAGWDVKHQVVHLAWTDEVALLAATDKARWDEVVLAALEDPAGFVDRMADEGAAAPGVDVLARWRLARPALAEALRAYPAGQRMPWFGPPMSPTSMATARFMETWAHGLDVHEALGVEPQVDDRIRHVAHLGVRTRDFAFGLHGLEPPAGEFRVSLTAPTGEVWQWGPDDAPQSVAGPAYDFCLLVTQRRDRAALALEATGPDADRWLDVAQAFAGPPGAGRGAG